MKIKRQALHNDQTSRDDTASSGCSISNGHARLNDVSSELLIEDETPNQIVTPNFPYIYASSSTM